MATPHTDWPKTLEWIEKQAQESLKSRFQTAEIIAKESQATLTVLLAAIGGSAAYAAKVFDLGPLGPIEVASAVVCVYLVTLAVALVVACMTFSSYPALYQEPNNLMHPNYSLDEIRQAELQNLQSRITESASINARRAKKLNQIRILATISPFLFALIATVFPHKKPETPSGAKVACQVAPQTIDKSVAKINCEMSK